MGCGVSRIDANGMVLPARLRPLFINRFEEMTGRRHNRPGLKESTHSKKNLLDDDDHASSAPKSMPPSPEGSVSGRKKPEDVKAKEPEMPKEEDSVIEIGVGHKDGVNSIKTGKSDDKKSTIEDAKDKVEAKIDDADADKEDSDDRDDDDGDQRMIKHEDDDFPGSPSFRVYFKDNEGNEPHDEDAVKEDAFFKETEESEDAISSKESSVDKKVIKRQRKKRSFKVLPKGGQAAMKNLMNMKSCYLSSHASHDRAHLLTGKTTT